MKRNTNPNHLYKTAAMKRIILLSFYLFLIISHVNSQSQVVYQTTTTGSQVLLFDDEATVGNSIQLAGTNRVISEFQFTFAVTSPGVTGVLEIDVYSDCPVNGNICGGNVTRYGGASGQIDLNQTTGAIITLPLSIPIDVSSDMDGIIHVTMRYVRDSNSPGGFLGWKTDQSNLIGSRPNNLHSICGSSALTNKCDYVVGTSSTNAMSITAIPCIVGGACDDGHANTSNDILDGNCGCLGTIINDICDDAISIGCGDTFTGTMADATLTDVNLCGISVINVEKDVWHSFQGTGGIVEFNLDSPTGGIYSSAIFTYTGDCNNLICVPDGSNSNSNGATRTRIITSPGVTYYVKIEIIPLAFSSNNYRLTMDCYPVAVPVDVIACSDDMSTIPLADYLLCERLGGTWSVSPNGLTPGAGFNSGGTFIPAGNPAGDYYFDYIVGSDVDATVKVTLEDSGVGVANPPLSLCELDTSIINLFNLLTGELPGGTWTLNAASDSPQAGTFDAAGGTFTVGSNLAGSYLFDYEQSGTVIPGVPALNCNYSGTSVTDNVGPNPAQFLGIQHFACTPDSRVMGCLQGTLEINITGNPTSDLRIAFAGINGMGVCEPLNLLPDFFPGAGIYSFNLADYPSLDLSKGICLAVLPTNGINTNFQFTATVNIDYEEIPASSGCGINSSTVQIDVNSCCTPATNATCSQAITLSCGDVVFGNTECEAVEAVPDWFFGTIDVQGVWYKYVGQGTPMQLTTCSANTDFDTHIAIFADQSGQASCSNISNLILDNDPNCTSTTSGASSIEIFGTPGVTFYILVSSSTAYGTGGSNLLPGGNFQLTFTCIDECPPNYNLTGSQSVDTTYMTPGSITSDQIIQSNAIVNYSAGFSDDINLEIGFEVQVGSIFHAYLDGCSN